MADIPQVEQLQLIKHVATIVSGIVNSIPVCIEFARGRDNALIVKSNAGQYKQKVYVNGAKGEFKGDYSFMVLSTVKASDGEESVLKATEPLYAIADAFDMLDASSLNLGENRKPVKIEMTTAPQDMAGVQENGDIIFFAAYTLQYTRTPVTNLFESIDGNTVPKSSAELNKLLVIVPGGDWEYKSGNIQPRIKEGNITL